MGVLTVLWNIFFQYLVCKSNLSYMPPQQFRYLNDREEQLSASLGQVVDVDSNPLFTIFDNTGTHIGNSEWLTYFGTDGGVWTTRCVAGYMGVAKIIHYPGKVKMRTVTEITLHFLLRQGSARTVGVSYKTAGLWRRKTFPWFDYGCPAGQS
jgi:hypothetical protein